MVLSTRREALGGETRDSSPEMVGGSWEGGFREERSKCTALRFMRLCEVREDRAVLEKAAIMIIDTESRSTLE